MLTLDSWENAVSLVHRGCAVAEVGADQR